MVVSSRHCFERDASAPVALILLNTPASFPALARVWRVASYRVAADGAANRLFDAVAAAAAAGGPGAGGGAAGGAGAAAAAPRAAAAGAPSSSAPPSPPGPPGPLLSSFLPDLIAGDWDSIRPDVAAAFAAAGVATAPDPDDQDSTDLFKCLAAVATRFGAPAKAHGAPAAPPPPGAAGGATAVRVIVFGAFGGRFDQEAQNINALYAWAGTFASMTLLSEDCLARLLPAGTSVVRVAAPWEGPTCGLVPVGAAATVSTEGLHWDVTDWPCGFGGRMSTSNRVEAWGRGRGGGGGSRDGRDGGGGRDGGDGGDGGDVPVAVTTSAPIVWTASVDLFAGGTGEEAEEA